MASLPEHNTPMQHLTRTICLVFLFSMLLGLLAGCASVAPGKMTVPFVDRSVEETPERQQKGNDVALFALSLIDTGYLYGGKNPSAGLDCSGMVQHIFGQAVGIKVGGSAADIARQARPVDPAQLRPGDLVFFNTRNRPFSHVGIYLGEDRFVHAPSEKGKVRIDSLKSNYFSKRFEAARSLLD